MTVMSLIPIDQTISRLLYNVNVIKYHKEIVKSYYDPLRFESIKAKIARFDKFTIVELTYYGKHYHGLTSMARCDKPNMYTGLAVAYNRAFEKMWGDIK